MSNSTCKCLKCGKVFKSDLNNQQDIQQIRKLMKEGCLTCHHKNLEWKEEVWGIETIHISNQCPQCQKPKIIDILNWEEIKSSSSRKSKQELIKDMNNYIGNACHCKKQEEETKPTNRTPWIVGASIIGILVIGIITLFVTKKWQKKLDSKKGYKV